MALSVTAFVSSTKVWSLNIGLQFSQFWISHV